jgi:hypothetical protein
MRPLNWLTAQTPMAAIGSIRGNAQNVQTQIANLEQDSLSADPNLNTEVSVLNKICGRRLDPSHYRQQTPCVATRTANHIAKQRQATTNAINADISRRANLPETWPATAR